MVWQAQAEAQIDKIASISLDELNNLLNLTKTILYQNNQVIKIAEFADKSEQRYTQNFFSKNNVKLECWSLNAFTKLDIQIINFYLELIVELITSKKLSKIEYLLSKIPSNSPIVIAEYKIIKEKVKFINITSNCQAILGLSKDEIINNSEKFWNLISARDESGIEKLIYLSNQNKVTWEAEFYIEGVERGKWIRAWGEPSDLPISVCTFLDITQAKLLESRKIEEKDVLQVQEYAQKEGLLRLLMEMIHEAEDIEKTLPTILTATRHSLQCDRIVVYKFNEDWSGYFIAESVAEGWTPLVTEPHTIFTDTCLQEKQGGRFQCRHYILVSNNIDQSDFVPCHKEFLKKLEVKALIVVPIFLEGKLWGLLAAYQNKSPYIWQINEIETLKHVSLHIAITLRQSQLYKDTKTQLLELEKLNHIKDKFLSAISHQLRSPLHKIQMAIKMLELRLQKENILNRPQIQLHQYLNIIKTSLQQEAKLVNNILDLTYFNSGTKNMELKMRICSIQEILDKVLSPILEYINEKEQRFILEKPVDLLNLYTYPQYLERILGELLENACKYSDSGETISLVVKYNEYDYTFEITNTGVTIPLEMREKIFQDFYCLTEDGSIGFGLSLVKKMVEQLRGNINVSSENGITKFTVVLPRSY